MAVNLFSSNGVNWCRNFMRPVRMPRGLCYLCNAPLAKADHLVCRACTRDLPFIHQACPVCALPGQSDAVCAGCLSGRQSPFTRTISVFRYEYPANRLITDMKYRARLPLCNFFAQLLAASANWRSLAHPEQFIPVPLHRARIAERGFNQSLLIAERLSAMTGIPVNTDACLRTRATRQQSGLSAPARRRNLKDAFAINDAASLGGHVAVVDDVVTTGTTAAEMAKLLVHAGAGRVDIWSCCRAL